MKVIIEFVLGSTEHEDDPSFEASRILRELAKRIEGHPHFSEGHCQPITAEAGDHIGWIDVK